MSQELPEALKVTTIESAAMRVDVVPEYGARVVHLINNATGRDWMAPGGTSSQVGEDAVYGRDEGVGWDECFPTVSVWDASPTGWKRKLRDHGDLWGRPWRVDRVSPSALATSYSAREYSFRRTLTVDGSTLTADYAVTNTGSVELPYLWALHGLLAAVPGDHIVLDGVSEVDSTYLSLEGHRYDAGSVSWPGPSQVYPVQLDLVHPPSSVIAAKLYARKLPTRSVAVGRGGAWLTIDWDETLDDLGIWLTYGGWPAPGGAQQLALEPTSASADHLGDALRQGTAVKLAPGQSRRWKVRLSLSTGPQPD
jgi:galactose mutarotase-like enzyme